VSRDTALRWLVRIVFVATVARIGWYADAYDLTASYVAGRMVWHGEAASLFTPVLTGTDWRANPDWARTVADSGIKPDIVTRYVQTPFWAWLVSPLASAMKFVVFKRLFAVLGGLAAVTMVEAATRRWAPLLAGPGGQAALLAGLTMSAPFLWAIALGQTHVLFLCLAVLGAVRATRGKPVSAGALLAAAAAVKITPLWVAVTWGVAGRWRAVASFAAFSIAFAVLAVTCTGWDAAAAYIGTLRAVSVHILLSFNNDAFAALLSGRQVTEQTAFQWHPVAMPGWLAWLSLTLLACCALAGGWIDRRFANQPGAVLTLIAATLFAPLAWNHYFIVLILPVAMFLHIWRAGGGRGWVVLTVCVLLLNLPPLAYGVGASLTVVALRSHAVAALLCIGGLLIAAARSQVDMRRTS
jgi:hypothetical protein